MARFTSLVCIALLALALIAPEARAQDADASARARALFTEGVQLSADGELVEAEARFREALTFRDAPAIRYNLASVLFPRGAYPEARALAESVLGDPTASAEIREHATTLLGQIDDQAGYVRITLHGTASVAIDDWTLTDPTAEVSVSPGEHTAVATREGVTVARAQVSVETGEHEEVELDASPPEVPPEALAATPAAEAPITEQWWFWTGIVVTVVGAAAVITAVAVTTPTGTEPAVQGNYEPGVLRF